MFFPYTDDNPRERFPVVTVSLIIVNIFIFLLLGTRSDYAAIVKEHGFIPNNSSFLTLITSIFLHDGVFHLAFNMWFLWLFGDNLEDKFGRVLFFVFFILGGIFGNVAHGISVNAATRNIPCIGASGAISAVMGGYIVFFPKVRVKAVFNVWFYYRIVKVSAFVLLGIWFLGQLFYSSLSGIILNSNIAYSAHIGGFIFGAVIAYIAKINFFPSKLFITPQNKQVTGESQELGQLTLNAEIKNSKIANKLEHYKGIIEDYLKKDDIDLAVAEYTEFERENIPGALKPEHQKIIADALFRQDKKILALQAYLRFVSNYIDHPQAATVECRIGLLCAQDFKNPAEAISYLRKGLKNIEDIKDMPLLLEARKQLHRINKKLKQSFVKIKDSEGIRPKFAILIQVINDDLLNADKISRVFESVGILGNKDMSMKLKHNVLHNIKTKDGVIMQDLSAIEATIATHKLQSIGIPVIAFKQDDLLKFPFITSINEASISNDSVTFKSEGGEQIVLGLADILYTVLGQIPYSFFTKAPEDTDLFSFESKDAMTALFPNITGEKWGSEIMKCDINRILDIFTVNSRRLRISKRHFNYLRYNNMIIKKDDSNFELFIEDLASVIGGEKIDDKLKIFISTNLWNALNFKSVVEFNERGLWVVRLKKAYDILLAEEKFNA